MRIATQLEREGSAGDSAAGIHLQPRPESLPPHENSGQLLEAWKDIAAYMRRDVRTVQRWEKLLELPIHRLTDSRSGSVFAYKRELDAWREMRAFKVEPCQTELITVNKAPEIQTPKITME